MSNIEYDVVNKPKHYNREGAMQCFDEFEMIYGIEAAMYACLFNIHKYRYRAADKNGQEDLKKSDWYMKKYQELKTKQEIPKICSIDTDNGIKYC